MNKKLIGLALLFIVFGLSMAGFFAQAQITTQPATLPNYTATQVLALVGRITNWIFTILMAVVVIMVLVAGYLFVTGGGNPDQVGKARQVLIYAMIGFAVGMIARGIIALVAVILDATVPTSPFGT